MITSSMMILFKDAEHKRSYFYESLPVPTKTALFSRRPIFLTILLNEQFLNLTQINTQLLSTQQHAYTLLFGYSWFDSVCITLACLNEFLRKPFT